MMPSGSSNKDRLETRLKHIHKMHACVYLKGLFTNGCFLGGSASTCRILSVFLDCGGRASMAGALFVLGSNTV